MSDDARLVDLYDTDNPDGPDHDFYRSLADEVEAGSVLEVQVEMTILGHILGGDPHHTHGVKTISFPIHF